jgi:hypothetical protein
MRGISNYAEIDDNGYVTRSDSDHNKQNGQNTSPAKKPEQPEEVPAGEEVPGADGAPQETPQEAPQPEQQAPPEEQLPDWAVDV